MSEFWWEGEDVISLGKVQQMHPRNIHVDTVRRWCKKGLLIGRRRIRLESFKEGGERFTTLQAYRRFVDKQNQ